MICALARTTEGDVDRSVEAIVRIARSVRAVAKARAMVAMLLGCGLRRSDCKDDPAASSIIVRVD